MAKIALIFGITGQDGSYLAEMLLYKGYEVHGVIRRASTFNTRRIDHIFDRLILHYGDVSDANVITELIYNIHPHEIYNLAAQSHVRVSFDMPVYTGDVTGLGTARILESIRKSGINARYYQASSSEMFGNAPFPQGENTPFQPRSPYACAKAYSYWMTKNYREAYGMYACNGILFNHESARRGPTFVTRKITRALAQILAGDIKEFRLGNIVSMRDWGYAPDYVEAMWQMLQQDKADDYVIGTGMSHSVESFLRTAFEYVGLDWRKHVVFDAHYARPLEVDCLMADIRKAKAELGWSPTIDFDTLVKIMVDADLTAIGLWDKSEGTGRAAVIKQYEGTEEHGWHTWKDQIVSMEDR